MRRSWALPRRNETVAFHYFTFNIFLRWLPRPELKLPCHPHKSFRSQNRRKFVHIICLKMKVNSHRRKILLFLSINMAAMMSHETMNSWYFPAFHASLLGLNALIGWTELYFSNISKGTTFLLQRISKNILPRPWNQPLHSVYHDYDDKRSCDGHALEKLFWIPPY